MAVYFANDTDLTAVADAIRTKGGTSAALEFPAEFVSAIANIPSGGQPETGSFIASGTGINLSLSVTKLCSKLIIWSDVIDASTDLSTKPYLANSVVSFIANNDNGLYTAHMISSLQTTFNANVGKIAGWPNQTAGGNDKVVFTATAIEISNARLGGSVRSFISDMKYNWAAW